MKKAKQQSQVVAWEFMKSKIVATPSKWIQMALSAQRMASKAEDEFLRSLFEKYELGKKVDIEAALETFLRAGKFYTELSNLMRKEIS
jgi:hypothetical protein